MQAEMHARFLSNLLGLSAIGGKICVTNVLIE